MTSTRLLLPGDTPTRAQLWRRWFLQSIPGRAALLGVAIKTFATVIGWIAPSWTALEAIDAVGSLALVFAVAYGVARGVIWAKRHLLWRVRRKLILSYIFVGLVPGLLIISFFLIAGLILFFNVSTYLLQSRVRSVVEQARFIAESVALEAAHGDPPETLRRTLRQRQATAAERYPVHVDRDRPGRGTDLSDRHVVGACDGAADDASGPGSISRRRSGCHNGFSATGLRGCSPMRALVNKARRPAW